MDRPNCVKIPPPPPPCTVSVHLQSTWDFNPREPNHCVCVCVFYIIGWGQRGSRTFKNMFETLFPPCGKFTGTFFHRTEKESAWQISVDFMSNLENCYEIVTWGRLAQYISTAVKFNLADYR